MVSKYAYSTYIETREKELTAFTIRQEMFEKRAQEQEVERIAREQKTAMLISEQQKTLTQAAHDTRILLTTEIETLKKYILDLEQQRVLDDEVRQQTDEDIKALQDKVAMLEKFSSGDYGTQAGIYLYSIAKVTCHLEKDRVITGSGSVWAYGGYYFLVTNEHVLEEADTNDGESCIIEIALDWNAISDDRDQAIQENKLLIYEVDTNYTYWDQEGLDFAITFIEELSQPISLLENQAMVPNAETCSTTLAAGRKIKIIGYPYTGPYSLPTVTEGIISSWNRVGDTTYYVTSAKIEHGNSGGVAVTDDYRCLVGIPSSVVTGSTESLGMILLLTEKKLQKYFDDAIELEAELTIEEN